MDWDKVRIFHAVAEAGSLTKAGDDLNLAQSSISRHIVSLEESLGVSLFHRHSRGLSLTEQGEYLYATTKDVYARLKSAENHLQDMQESAEGPLVITSTNFFGSSWLAQNICEFIRLYPSIQVHLKQVDRELDLGMREADVAIRMKQPSQMDVIQRRLVDVNFGLYTTQQYLDNAAPLNNPDDLKNHHLICYPDNTKGPFHEDNWLVEIAGISLSSHKKLTVTANLYSIYKLASNNLGVACLPTYFAANNPYLVKLFPDLSIPPVTGYLCYPEELKGSQRIHIFKEYIVEKIKQTQF